MNKMHKMIAVAAVLLIALTVVGVTSALWSKVLDIGGFVETGSVDAIFTTAFTDDDETVDDPLKDSLDNGLDPAEGGNDTKARYDKNVGFSNAYIDGGDPQQAHVEIYNCYPSYWTTAWFDIKNMGTVPVKIQFVKINGVKVTPCVLTPFNLDGNPGYDVEIHVTGIEIGTQIDSTNNDNTVQMDLEIHVLQDAPQGGELNFNVEVLLVQWNEYKP